MGRTVSDVPGTFWLYLHGKHGGGSSQLSIEGLNLPVKLVRFLDQLGPNPDLGAN